MKRDKRRRYYTSVIYGELMRGSHAGLGIQEHIHPNSNPLKPADRVSNQTNSPGCRRFFSSRRETSSRSSSSALSRRESNGSSAVEAMFSSGMSVVEASVFVEGESRRSTFHRSEAL